MVSSFSIFLALSGKVGKNESIFLNFDSIWVVAPVCVLFLKVLPAWIRASCILDVYDKYLWKHLQHF